MTEDKWREIKGEIKDKFEILEEDSHMEDDEKVETIIFNGPLGKMKVEWVEHPKVLDVKTQYSKRAGTTASVVERVISREEKISFIKAYTFKDGDWVKIEAENLEL